MRIIVADDCLQNREMLANLLATRGHDVTTATNGQQALERLRQETPDVLVLDLMMPILDGLDVLAEMRTDRTLAGVPVVVVTAAGPEADDQARALGAAAVLSKPYEPADLERAVAAAAIGR